MARRKDEKKYLTESDLCFLIEKGELKVDRFTNLQYIGKTKGICKDFRFK